MFSIQTISPATDNFVHFYKAVRKEGRKKKGRKGKLVPDFPDILQRIRLRILVEDAFTVECLLPSSLWYKLEFSCTTRSPQSDCWKVLFFW